jgi:uncharacterized protein
MKETDGSTQVDVETDLTITGKPAQFGRGVMAEISGKLITQFADCLADTIAGPSEAAPSEPAPSEAAPSPAGDLPADQQASPAADHNGATPQAPTTPPTVTPPLKSVTPTRPTPEAIDLLGTAGLPVLKRLAPFLAVFGVVLGVLVIRRRRR